MMVRCKKEEMGMFVIMAKKIWARRNAVIHEDCFQHPNQLIREAKESLELFSGQAREDAVEETTVTTNFNNATELQVKWHPPPGGRYKLNWDVALDFKNKLMGIGVVVSIKKKRNLVTRTGSC